MHHLRAAGQSEQADRIRALAEKQRHSEGELQRLIASRDAITKEIQRLRKVTGQHHQVVAHVKVCELSRNKARRANINVEGVESKWLLANGFSGALSAGILDHHGRAEEASRVESGGEAFQMRLIENDEVLGTIVAALKKAGVLRVLAEPTLATISGRPASIHVGGEFPVPVPQSNGDSAIEFQKFGTQLDFLPVVVGNGRIRIEVRPRICEIDSDRNVVLGDVTVPGLRVREVDTAIEMRVGQTLVLAGLVQQRAVPKVRGATDSGEADRENRPAPIPSKPREANTGLGQDEIEEIELIVMVRAEYLEVPKVARRAARE